ARDHHGPSLVTPHRFLGDLECGQAASDPALQVSSHIQMIFQARSAVLQSFRGGGAEDPFMLGRITQVPETKRGRRPRGRRPVRISPAFGSYEQPMAYLVRKQEKSLTLRLLTPVEPSQLAYGSPAAYLDRKHVKSLTFRT